MALQSIAAAVLGGASLAGGRGSFVGAVLAAVFLSLILNVLPLFQTPSEYGQIAIGGLTLPGADRSIRGRRCSRGCAPAGEAWADCGARRLKGLISLRQDGAVALGSRCPVAGGEWSAPTHMSWVAGVWPGRATYGGRRP